MAPSIRPLLVLILCVASAPPVRAQSRRPLAAEDYYRIRDVGSPEISPDGRWVAFTVSRRIEATNADSSEVWLVPADASAEARRVSRAGEHARTPRWTSSGRLRYGVGDRVVELDPGADAPPQQADAEPDGVASPDGRWRAVARDMPAAGRARSFASDFERRHDERFQGKRFDWLAFQRDGGPFPVPDPRDPHASPPAEIVLTGDGGERPITRLGLQPRELVWTPDARTLVFVADSTYRDEMRYGRGDLWSVTIDGAVHRLTRDERYVHRSPAISPDGRTLAFVRGYATDHVIRAKLDHGGPTDLWTMPVHGGEPVNLTEQWDLQAGAPMWSPDGRFIYFTAGVGGERHLFRVPARGGPVEQVTSGPRRISGLSIDRAFRRMAYLVDVHEAPPEVHVANIDGSGERQLTRIHEPLLAEIEFARAERIRFTSADGTPIEGWVLLPPGYDRARGPWPLVVNSHGGPHSASGYGFNFKHQLFAAHGYLVLETNFRSSTGYGEDFLWATWGAWGTKDGQDVVAGVDHVIANHAADANRVGTMGHSYGGFMTNWLITQYPDRFAAAIAGAGISNWVSDYGTADIARTKETEFFGYPWEAEARDIMIRQSPLTWAGKVRTPTLFVHGEIDQRVPYEEAEQMYTALKKRGVPAEMIIYDGQSHGIRGHWNGVHRMLNELGWLEKWLKDKRQVQGIG